MMQLARHPTVIGLLMAFAVTGCQRGDDHPEPALAAALSALPSDAQERALVRELVRAPGRISFAAEVEGVVRTHSMELATLAATVSSPDDAGYFPAPGSLELAIVVDGTGEEHREQLALRGPSGDWRRIGAIAGALRNPSVATDGSWVAFESSAESFRDIYRVDVRNGAVRRLTHDGDGAFDPDVSPTGRRIVFVSTVSGEPEVHGMDPDGANRERLVDAPGQEHTPRWAPDGTAIAFAGDRDGPERLFVLDVRTAEVSRVTSLERVDRHEGDPVWSPDGTRLAYVVHYATGPRELWVVNRGGGEPVLVSAAAAHVVTASWSPNGRYLVYDEHATAGRHVTIARADGTARTRIGPVAQERWLPRWR